MRMYSHVYKHRSRINHIMNQEDAFNHIMSLVLYTASNNTNTEIAQHVKLNLRKRLFQMIFPSLQNKKTKTIFLGYMAKNY